MKGNLRSKSRPVSLSKPATLTTLALLAALSVNALAFGRDDTISTAFQDSYPKFYLDDKGKIAGICNELALELLTRLPEHEDKSSYRLMPLRRIHQRLTEKDGIDFFMCMARDEQRADIYEFAEPPLYQVNNVIAVRKDDPADITSLDEIPDKELVMTIGGSSTERFLKDIGSLNVDGSANESSQLLRKLVHRRGRFVYFNDITLRAEVKRLGLQKQVRILPYSFRKYAHYLVINNNIKKEKRDAILNAFESMRKEGVITKILNHYLDEE